MMDKKIVLVCFGLKKRIEDLEVKKQIDGAIDEIVKKYELKYAVDGHYVIPESVNIFSTIDLISEDVKNSILLNEYIDVSVSIEV